MRNNWRLIAAAAAILIVITLLGCGAVSSVPEASPPQQTGASAPENNTVEEPEEETTETSGPAEEAGGEAPAAEGEDEPEASDPEEQQPEDQVIEQDYYMDRNYIIRPKDEAGERKVVLLTFDDGPKDEDVLTAMLDTLERHEAKAIFFINGYRAKQNPDLLRLIYDRGQMIGNHSWDHVDLKKEPQETMEQQIDDVQSYVEEMTGERPVFFRPPFGSGNDAVKQKAADAGLLYMTWSNGSMDWEKGYNVPQKVIDSVLEQLHPGSNILMHELPWTEQALDELLTELANRGYSFLHPKRIDPNYSKN